METQYSTEMREQGREAVCARSCADAGTVKPENVTQFGMVPAGLWYGLDLAWYMRVIRAPSLYGGVLALCAALLAASLPEFWGDGADAFSFIIKLAVWLTIGWQAVRMHHARVGVAALAGGLSGLAVGVALALLRVLVVREVWTLFNLIVEPVVTGIFGYMVSGAAALSRKPFTPLRERNGHGTIGERQSIPRESVGQTMSVSTR